MEWLPAISTTSVLALTLWLGRNLIITRLTNSVKHEYDKQIEQIKADLKAKETQISALRSGALSGVANRQAVIFEKQLNAIDYLWDCVIALAPAKNVSAMMVSIKFEAAAKESAKNPQFREIFEIMGKFDIEQLGQISASKVRPFISPLAWAYYSAYNAIVMNAVLRMHMLKSGLDTPDILDTKNVEQLVKTALPHQLEYIEKYGPSAFHYLLEELENKLLLAFKLMIDGESNDKEALERAAAILKETEKLMSDNASKQE